MAARYAVAPAETRLRVVLDGYTLVYDRASGATHILATPAPELIDVLADGAATLDEIAVRLRATHDLGADDALTPVLTARLAELVASGLVRRG